MEHGWSKVDSGREKRAERMRRGGGEGVGGGFVIVKEDPGTKNGGRQIQDGRKGLVRDWRMMMGERRV